MNVVCTIRASFMPTWSKDPTPRTLAPKPPIDVHVVVVGKSWGYIFKDHEGQRRKNMYGALDDRGDDATRQAFIEYVAWFGVFDNCGPIQHWERLP